MITVILCAAGSGSRANLSENKILHELNGLPVLSYSLSAFSPFADEILVACRREDETRISSLLAPYPQARTTLGGKTRAESVYRALSEAKGEIVLVHDAARPFVTARAIRECIESVKEFGSGVCALPATDTTALVDGDKISDVLLRDRVRIIQTPQGFYLNELKLAYEKAFDEGRLSQFTDDSGLYRAYIAPPRVFSGDRENRKLTFPEDFSLPARVGFGIDTHSFGKRQSFIILGGIKIPAKSGLLAHSDGDVLTHALMDAMLTAANLKDIGFYFPDTDEQYAGADSMKLLARVKKMVNVQGFSLQNASIAILAQTPRLSPYLDEIRKNLSAALDCDAIGISAGTNEKLGYIGEEKGITVYAAVLLKESRSAQESNFQTNA